MGSNYLWQLTNDDSQTIRCESIVEDMRLFIETNSFGNKIKWGIQKHNEKFDIIGKEICYSIEEAKIMCEKLYEELKKRGILTSIRATQNPSN